MKSQKKSLKIKFQFLVAILLLSVITVVFFSVFFYQAQKSEILKGIDNKLYTAALMAKEVIPKDYHDKIVNPSSITEKEYLAIVDQYNKICESLGMEYIWSLLKTDESIVFTTATSPDKIAANKQQAAFFETHSNPELYNDVFLTEKPTYQIINDKWGRIRVVLVPFLDHQGRQYLFGSSIRIDVVDAQLRTILLKCLGISILALLTILFAVIILSNSVTKPINRMITSIKAIIDGKGNEEIPETGSYEQIELSSIFNKLNKAMHSSIATLQEKEQNLRITMQSMGDGVIVTDARGNITMMNGVAQELTGWLLDKAKGLPFSHVFNIVSSLTGEPGEAIVDSVLQSGKKVLLANHTDLISANGKRIHINDSAAPILDMSGSIMGVVVIFSDITERYAMQSQIRESELRFRGTFEQAAVGICHVSLSGRFLKINEKFCNMLGYEHSELINKDFSSITHPDDLELSRKNFDELLSGTNSANTFDKRYFKKDGSIVWVNLTHALMRDESGNILYFISVFQDITEKKNVDAALKSSESRLNRAQTLAHVGNWELDQTSMNMWASNEAFEIYGMEHSSQWIDLKQAQKLVVQEDRALMDSALLSLMKQGTPYDVEFRINRENDGEMRYIHSFAQIEYDEKNHPSKILGVIQDITDKKVAEVSIRRAEEEYKTVLQTTMDGFWIHDKKGRFLDVNNALCELIGYSRSELLSMSISDIEAMESSAEVEEHIRKIIVAADRFETKHRCKNGKVIDVEVSVNYMKASDRLCTFVRNITDRKKKEEDIYYLSYHDSLTGLHNRAYFEDRCKRLDGRTQLPTSFIMGDINGLKLTNDVFGHVEGDKLLISMALILRTCTRTGDIAARFGGDEFCIMLPRTNNKTAQKISERIYKVCEQYEMVLGDEVYHPSISLGCSTITDASQTIENALKEAEDIMYRRKLLERKSMHSSLITSIKTTMLEKSHETKEHADRLVAHTKNLGKSINLSDDQLSELELLSMLHDLGKISIDDHILNKPSELTADEWNEIKKHPEVGYRIALSSPELVHIAEYILCHHERWDGKGYPQGLKGAEIPLLSRIISVVDSFDAMTNDRAYRKGMSKGEALQEIRVNSGLQFDPFIVEMFLEVV